MAAPAIRNNQTIIVFNFVVPQISTTYQHYNAVVRSMAAKMETYVIHNATSTFSEHTALSRVS